MRLQGPPATGISLEPSARGALGGPRGGAALTVPPPATCLLGVPPPPSRLRGRAALCWPWRAGDLGGQPRPAPSWLTRDTPPPQGSLFPPFPQRPTVSLEPLVCGLQGATRPPYVLPRRPRPPHPTPAPWHTDAYLPPSSIRHLPCEALPSDPHTLCGLPAPGPPPPGGDPSPGLCLQPRRKGHPREPSTPDPIHRVGHSPSAPTAGRPRPNPSHT